MKLYRPTGLRELELVFQAGMRAWPPRLPEQPIFYPVTNLDYAVEIATNWNTKDERLVGYVTAFELDDGFAQRYEPRIVGAQRHRELWVPADELPLFNYHLRSPIELVDARFGAAFEGLVPDSGPLCGLDAAAQWLLLGEQPHIVSQAVQHNRLTLFLHFPFWTSEYEHGPAEAVLRAWQRANAGLPLLDCRAKTA